MDAVTIDTVTVIMIGAVAALFITLTALVVAAYVNDRNERRFNDWLRRQDRGETRKPVSRWTWTDRRDEDAGDM